MEKKNKTKVHWLCKQKNQTGQIYAKNGKHTPNSPSSMSMGSGLAGLVSGFGSISPGFSFRGSSAVSSSLSLCAALSLKTHCECHHQLFVFPQTHNNHPLNVSKD